MSEIEFVLSSFPQNPQNYVNKIKIKGKGRKDTEKWKYEDCEKLMEYFPNLKEIECTRNSTPFTDKHMTLFENVSVLNFTSVQTRELGIEDFEDEDGYYANLEERVLSSIQKSSLKTDYIFIGCGYSDRLIGVDNKPIFPTKSYELIKPKEEEKEEEEEEEEKGEEVEVEEEGLGGENRFRQLEQIFKGMKFCFFEENEEDSTLQLMKSIATGLGATYTPNVTRDVTHFICPNDATQITDRVKQALSNGKTTKIVSTGWIFDCFPKCIIRDESNYLMFRNEQFGNGLEFDLKEYKVIFICENWNSICHEFEKGGREIHQKFKELHKKAGIECYIDGVLFSGMDGTKLGVCELERIVGVLKPNGVSHCGCFGFYEYYDSSVFKFDGKTFFFARFDTESG